MRAKKKWIVNISIRILFVPDFKVLHERDERLHALDGHGVVDARAHAADDAVALQVDEALRRGGLHERGVLLGVAGDEGHVHAAAVLCAGGAMEQRALVEEVVEQLRLLDVDLLERRHAALRKSRVAQGELALAQHQDFQRAVEVERGVNARNTCSDD